MRLSRCLLYSLGLALGLLAACRPPDHELPDAEVDSSNTLTKDLRRHLSERPRLDTFRTALRRTGLLKRLGEEGPYTIFAPTNEAFAKAPASFDTLYFGGGADSLRPLLKYHVAYGRYDASRVGDSLRISTLSNASLLLRGDTAASGGFRIQGRAPLESVPAQNGFLYPIPALLRPSIDTTASS